MIGNPWKSFLTVLLLGILCSHCAVSFHVTPTRSNICTARVLASIHSNPVKPSPLFMSIPTNAPNKRHFWSVFKRNSNSNNNDDDVTRENKSRFLVKPRPLVTIDSSTGTITEVPMQSSTIQQQHQRKSKWESFKNAIYGTVDHVSSYKNLLGRKSKNENSSILGRPKDGYGELIEATLETKTQEAPGKRLMKQYQERMPLGTSSAFQQDLSFFDSFKEGIYSTVNGVTSLMQSTTVEHLPTSPLNAFKPLSKPSLAASMKVKEALPDLTSTNPLKRAIAERTIAELDAQQQKKQANILNQENPILSLKNGFYGFIDAIQTMVNVVSSIPDKVAEAAMSVKEAAMNSYKWVASIPLTFEQAADTINSIPVEIEKALKGAQSSIDQSILATQMIAEDVQALPDTVQKSVQVMQNSIDESVTNVKVMVGVEKRQPTPPKVPPPVPVPETVNEVAWKVAGAAASESGKIAWSLGAVVAKLGWKGTQLAFSSASTAISKSIENSKIAQVPQQIEMKDVSTELDTQISAALQSADVALVGSKKALEQEVLEALRLAETAMQKANDGRSFTNSGIDASLRIAKEAAVRATKDAASIERKLKVE